MSRKAYPSDLTDTEWQEIKPLLPAENAIGRPRQVDLREILNGIFYVLSEGCRWRALPHDLPPWQTAYNYFRHWQRLGIWQQIHTQLRQRVRKSVNKAELPTAGMIDSQSIKTTGKKGEVYGFDGGKLVKGRKRFILVDTLGLLLAVVVTEANFPERLGGVVVTMEAAPLSNNLILIWVDAGFSGENFARVIQQVCSAQVEVVCRSQREFQVLPKRWIVERTFAWWNQYRRLSKDYELLPEVSESMIYTVMIRLMLKRLAQSHTTTS
ncbi:IS5 family transposase [Chroococcidiopsis sp. CCALA 051]|uniref:IS5 family transposase n=1 Tax=Chroococcidiopsis sp. CCALA 051 TaxID=869949 RepID=UPI001E5D0E2E|nr:IS5 family transposase [Chroococcidiopsis sp. CCALA 051]